MRCSKFVSSQGRGGGGKGFGPYPAECQLNRDNHIHASHGPAKNGAAIHQIRPPRYRGVWGNIPLLGGNFITGGGREGGARLSTVTEKQTMCLSLKR